jgi:glycosyltransferase involved in cell wall biosynthesis
MDVSVVIPSYNSADLIVDAIESVIAQTHPPAEILVVDDGSTDGTGERLRAYSGVIRYLRQENRGVSAARNRGVEKARCSHVAFLDADDVWHPRKLELQASALQRIPGLALLGTTSFLWPSSAFPEITLGVSGALAPISWNDLAVKNYLTTSSILARRDVMIRAGLFDTAFQTSEDRDLWIRVAAIAAVANLVLPLTGYRAMVPGSLSKQAATCQAGMLKIVGKLDRGHAWGKRRLLRRKALGYLYHSCAYLHNCDGSYGVALANMARSFFWYPLPYRRDEVGTILERPKRLAVILARTLGLKRSERPPRGEDGCPTDRHGRWDVPDAGFGMAARASVRPGAAQGDSGHPMP